MAMNEIYEESLTIYKWKISILHHINSRLNNHMLEMSNISNV